MAAPPIFIMTGPPAVGKSALAHAVLQRFEFGLHLPVDELREFVVSGIAHPVGWTEETTRQFGLAAEAAADLTVRYHDAGFAVAIDHCHSPYELAALAERRFAGRPVYRVVVLASLETNHRRNRERTNKAFGPEVLAGTIDRLNPLFQQHDLTAEGWIVFENEEPGLEAAADRLLQMCGLRSS